MKSVHGFNPPKKIPFSDLGRASAVQAEQFDTQAEQFDTQAKLSAIREKMQLYRNVPTKFKKITISHENISIVIEPFEIYNIYNDNDTINNSYYRVVIYKFTKFIKEQIEGSQEKHIIILAEGIVPYYLSDGHTNNFRGNILLPFMCFSNMPNDKFCPHTNYKNPTKNDIPGMLIKYKFWPTIDTLKIQENIMSKVNEIDGNVYNIHNIVEDLKSIKKRAVKNSYDYNKSQSEINHIYFSLLKILDDNNKLLPIRKQKELTRSDIISKINEGLLYVKIGDEPIASVKHEIDRSIIGDKSIIHGVLYYLSSQGRKDIYSFIDRIDNLIDYIIMLVNLVDKSIPQELQPSAQSAVHEQLLSVDPVDYFFPHGIRFGDADNFDKYNMEKPKTRIYTDKFRIPYIKTMLEKFKEQKEYILSNNIISVEDVEFNASTIEIKSYTEFNEYVNRCKYTKMKEILNIFNDFASMFKTIINTKPDKPIRDELINCITNVKQVENFPDEHNKYINDYNNSYNLIKWHTICQRKYIKYKAKYLALKKSLGL